MANPNCVFTTKKVDSGTLTANHEVLVSDLRDLSLNEKEKTIKTGDLFYYKAKQNIYQRTHNYSLITKGFQKTNLVERLQESSYSLKEFLEEEIQRGISADYSKAFIVNEKTIQENKFEREICKPIITGHNIFRFGIEFLNEYIFYLTRNDNITQKPNVEKYLKGFKDKITCKEVREGKHPWYSLHRPRDPIIFRGPKLVGLTTSDRLIVGMDTGELFAMDNLYIIHLKSKDIRDYYWMLSVLNSSLISFAYRFLAQEEGRILPQVKAENLYALPIYIISFFTSKDERAKLFAKAKDHYKRYIKEEYPEHFLNFIESRLTKEHRPDKNLVRKHNLAPMNKNRQIKEDALIDQSDVAYDILAFLAENMLVWNKEKQKEINGFVEWLESQLKIQPDREGNTGIEALTGKTHVKNYLGDYQKVEEHLSFDEFWKIFEKNKNRINANLKSREIFETFKTEYEKSLSRLLPIKEKLRKTDWLIDQIVYKL